MATAPANMAVNSFEFNYNNQLIKVWPEVETDKQRFCYFPLIQLHDEPRQNTRYVTIAIEECRNAELEESIKRRIPGRIGGVELSMKPINEISLYWRKKESKNLLRYVKRKCNVVTYDIECDDEDAAMTYVREQIIFRTTESMLGQLHASFHGETYFKLNETIEGPVVVDSKKNTYQSVKAHRGGGHGTKDKHIEKTDTVGDQTPATQLNRNQKRSGEIGQKSSIVQAAKKLIDEKEIETNKKTTERDHKELKDVSDISQTGRSNMAVNARETAVTQEHDKQLGVGKENGNKISGQRTKDRPEEQKDLGTHSIDKPEKGLSNNEASTNLQENQENSADIQTHQLLEDQSNSNINIESTIDRMVDRTTHKPEEELADISEIGANQPGKNHATDGKTAPSNLHGSQEHGAEKSNSKISLQPENEQNIGCIIQTAVTQEHDKQLGVGEENGSKISEQRTKDKPEDQKDLGTLSIDKTEKGLSNNEASTNLQENQENSADIQTHQLYEDQSNSNINIESTKDRMVDRTTHQPEEELADIDEIRANQPGKPHATDGKTAPSNLHGSQEHGAEKSNSKISLQPENEQNIGCIIQTAVTQEHDKQLGVGEENGSKISEQRTKDKPEEQKDLGTLSIDKTEKGLSNNEASTNLQENQENSADIQTHQLHEDLSNSNIDIESTKDRMVDRTTHQPEEELADISEIGANQPGKPHATDGKTAPSNLHGSQEHGAEKSNSKISLQPENEQNIGCIIQTDQQEKNIFTLDKDFVLEKQRTDERFIILEKKLEIQNLTIEGFLEKMSDIERQNYKNDSNTLHKIDTVMQNQDTCFRKIEELNKQLNKYNTSCNGQLLKLGNRLKDIDNEAQSRIRSLEDKITSIICEKEHIVQNSGKLETSVANLRKEYTAQLDQLKKITANLSKVFDSKLKELKADVEKNVNAVQNKVSEIEIEGKQISKSVLEINSSIENNAADIQQVGNDLGHLTIRKDKIVRDLEAVSEKVSEQLIESKGKMDVLTDEIRTITADHTTLKTSLAEIEKNSEERNTVSDMRLSGCELSLKQNNETAMARIKMISDKIDSCTNQILIRIKGTNDRVSQLQSCRDQIIKLEEKIKDVIVPRIEEQEYNIGDTIGLVGIIEEDIKDIHTQMKTRFGPISLSDMDTVVLPGMIASLIAIVPPEVVGADVQIFCAEWGTDKKIHSISYTKDGIKKHTKYFQDAVLIYGIGADSNGKVYTVEQENAEWFKLVEYVQMKKKLEEDLTFRLNGAQPVAMVLKKNTIYLQTLTHINVWPLKSRDMYNGSMIDTGKSKKLKLPDGEFRWPGGFSVSDEGRMFIYCHQRKELLYLNRDAGYIHSIDVRMAGLPISPALVFPCVRNEANVMLAVYPESGNEGVIINATYSNQIIGCSTIVSKSVGSRVCNMCIADDYLACRYFNAENNEWQVRLHRIN
ncbi:uncharacterized protein LOC141899926 [Tubulanus polymorphus]|uniref:uncharacterized protein LOC141899926 n=1 Tax=Tubulanus polymorphus TaxID=672921 RepID=UPI003DA1E7BB